MAEEEEKKSPDEIEKEEQEFLKKYKEFKNR